MTKEIKPSQYPFLSREPLTSGKQLYSEEKVSEFKKFVDQFTRKEINKIKKSKKKSKKK